jgi:DNA-binding FadR family transcriptional regulator
MDEISADASTLFGGDAEELTRNVVFSPIRGSGLVEQTVRRLGEAIEFGLLRSGERFPPEAELAGRLQVSMVTLREALAVLREADYLETRRGRMGGNFVQAPQGLRAPARTGSLSLDEVRDLIDYREVIATGAAVLACRRARPEDVALLREQLKEMAEAPTYIDWRRTDSRFHITIAAAARSARFVAAETEVQAAVSALLNQYARHPRILKVINEQHTKIVDAIAAGTEDVAVTETETHVRNTAETLMGIALAKHDPPPA